MYTQATVLEQLRRAAEARKETRQEFLQAIQEIEPRWESLADAEESRNIEVQALLQRYASRDLDHAYEIADLAETLLNKED
jgi:hypothetical protein